MSPHMLNPPDEIETREQSLVKIISP